MLQFGLKIFPNTSIYCNLAFRGPCVLMQYSHLVRCKIDMFSSLGLYSNCCTSSIGRYCSIGENVRLGMGHHDLHTFSTSKSLCEGNLFDFAGYHCNYMPKYRTDRKQEETTCVTVGNDVWIGANVIVPSDVIIGHGAVLGAGAIITKDVPPYAVVVGHNRIIRQRFSDEVISDMLELQWWNYNIPEMLKQGLELDINQPQECIQRIKDCDPEKLIPIPKQWKYVYFDSTIQNVDKLQISNIERDDFTSYYDPRHPDLLRIVYN